MGLYLVYFRNHVSWGRTRLERWVGRLRKGFQCLWLNWAPSSSRDSSSGVWESKHIRRLKALS